MMMPDSNVPPFPQSAIPLGKRIAILEDPRSETRWTPCTSTLPSDLSIHGPLASASTMLALISHDLRHPLTIILANAEFLARSDSSAQRGDLYGEIRWAVDHMNDLISLLIEFSKGRDALQPARQSIRKTVEEAVRMARAREEFRRIAIKIQHTGQIVGWFDTRAIERVVANLVLNACEAVSADTGQIIVSTAGDPFRLQICVWDNGPGVPAAIRESLFQPFVTAGKVEGSGLGLAIAKKLVEDHGGEIRLDEGHGNGTPFRITIPFSNPDEAASYCKLEMCPSYDADGDEG
jgi:signal transduction histidine kinase